MLKFDAVRDRIDTLYDLWQDRDIHMPRLKRQLRTTSWRFRRMDVKQKRSLLAFVGFILLMQTLFIVAS